MKKFFIILCSALLSAGSLNAQVDREVEVTKAYVPTVSRAEKPILRAQIADTAFINPDVDYSITPLSITTPLQTLPIKPATVTYWEFNKPAMAQVKVGVGVPYNSLLQAYGATHNASVGYAAANIDHSGIYSAITNSLGQSVDATQALNSGALAAGLYLGAQTLAADVGYSNNLFNNYAYEQKDSPLINYQSAKASIKFGDNFVDFKRLNFGVGVDYSHFWDRESNRENLLALSGVAGKDIDLGRVISSINYSQVSGEDSYKDSNLGLDLSLEKRLARWQLMVGLRYNFEKNSSAVSTNSYQYLIPLVTIRRVDANIVSPFAEVGGGFTRNDFASLAAVNPYVAGGKADRNSVEYDFRAGVEGVNKSATLSYRLFLEHQIGVNSRYWALIVEDQTTTSDLYNSYFDLHLGSLNTSSLNLNITYRPLASLALSFDSSYNSYSEENGEGYVNSNPQFEASVGARYSYRKFKAGISGEYLGVRRFSLLSYYNYVAHEIDPSFNLDAFVEWRKSDSLSIFVEGSNLCNSNLYPWPMYRGFGIAVTAGVKINFR